ncbi:hypothetical protein JW948_17960 [bacterium]|nr:hypothetical protein [bacterium]
MIFSHLRKSWFLFILFCISVILPADGFTEHAPVSGDAKPASHEGMQPPDQFSGYAQMRLQINGNKPDGFDIRRVRTSYRNHSGNGCTLKIQAELAGTGPKLLDAEMSFAFHAFRLKAGQFVIPFSYENCLSTPKMTLIDRSLAVEALCARSGDVLGNQSGRDIGVQLSGLFQTCEIHLGLFNGSGINRADLNDSKDLIGRGVWRPVKDLGLGASFYKGRMKAASTGLSEPRERLGAELAASWRPVGVTAEIIHGRDGAVRKSGWAVQTNVALVPHRLTGVWRSEAFDDDGRPSTRTCRHTAGIVWNMHSHALILLNIEFYENQEPGQVILGQLQTTF